MVDLAVGLALVGAASLGSMWLGHRIARRVSQRTTDLLAVTSVLLLLWFALYLHGRLILAGILPLSNVVVLGNWIPLLGSCAAGVIAADKNIPVWRRRVFGAMLLGFGWYSVFSVLLRPVPALGAPQYMHGFCIQTSPSSCSACCAATLLREHGIRTSETEMTRLCLTGPAGTPELGLYRGLKQKVRDTNWSVDVVVGGVDKLREPAIWPVLLLVESERPSRSPRAWWEPGPIADHAVILFGITPEGSADIGDPVIGRTAWSMSELQDRYTGVALRLIPKGAAGP